MAKSKKKNAKENKNDVMSRTLVSLLKYGNLPYCLGEAYPAIFSPNGQPCTCHICCKQRAEFGHMMTCIVWPGMDG